MNDAAWEADGTMGFAGSLLDVIFYLLVVRNFTDPVDSGM